MSIPKSRPTNSKAEGPLRPGHYFDAEPAVASQPRVVRLHLGEIDLELQADRGVFGSKGVDLGTLTLLREAPAPPAEGEILDLGSGYGPIAITLARRSPGARVWAVDINERALELTRVNAEATKAGNVVACKPEDMPADIRFDAIYSNPPVRVGKAPLPGTPGCPAEIQEGLPDHRGEGQLLVLPIYGEVPSGAGRRGWEDLGLTREVAGGHLVPRAVRLEKRLLLGADPWGSRDRAPRVEPAA